MKARDVMSHPVITIRADTTLKVATDIITQHGFTGLPVTDDDDHLVGIVTEADLLRAQLPRYPHSSAPGSRASVVRTGAHATIVADVMTTSVECMTPGAELADMARIMIDERIRSIPIVDGDHIAGIVTRRDLLRGRVSRTDTELADAVARELGAYADPDRWSVTVKAGVADIRDHVDNADDRRVAVRLAAGVPGVVGAQAHFETSDPF